MEKPLVMLYLSKFLLLKNWKLIILSCFHLKFLNKKGQEPNESRVGEEESGAKVESALCAQQKKMPQRYVEFVDAL